MPTTAASTDAVRARLRDALDPAKVVTAPEVLASRATDYWVLSHLDAHDGVTRPTPCAVVRPTDTRDVVAAVRACRDAGAAIVPYGLGSGVCGAIRCDAGAVVIDLSSMASVREVDVANLRATFDAGVRGADAESAVQSHGLTLGHSPQSMHISTVGGWVATRSSGQWSTRHGNIEDLVLGLEVVLPDGAVLVTRDVPRAAAGPDLRHLFLGSEGTLGVVTAVSLSLRREPERRVLAAYVVDDVARGLDAMRALLQQSIQPAVLRLYDAPETQRHHGEHCPHGACAMVLVHEGPDAMARCEAEVAGAALRAHGCRDASPEIAARWLARRYEYPSFAELVAQGLIFDTIEVAAPWTALPDLYTAVTRRMRALDGVMVASAHASHAYRSGANLYFTFAGTGSDSDAKRALYRACWSVAMEETLRGGGTIAHHHGVGRVRLPWLADELGDAGVAAYAAIRRALDPTGMMNPGALTPTVRP